MFSVHYSGCNILEESFFFNLRIGLIKYLLISFSFLGFWNMNPSFFLTVLCLGVASAAPKLDPNLDAHWHQWKATHKRLYGMVGNIWKCPEGPSQRMVCAVGLNSFWSSFVNFDQGSNLIAYISEHSMGIYSCVGVWRTAPRSIKPFLTIIFLCLKIHLVNVGWILSRN